MCTSELARQRGSRSLRLNAGVFRYVSDRWQLRRRIGERDAHRTHLGPRRSTASPTSASLTDVGTAAALGGGRRAVHRRVPEGHRHGDRRWASTAFSPAARAVAARTVEPLARRVRRTRVRRRLRRCSSRSRASGCTAARSRRCTARRCRRSPRCCRTPGESSCSRTSSTTRTSARSSAPSPASARMPCSSPRGVPIRSTAGRCG